MCCGLERNSNQLINHLHFRMPIELYFVPNSDKEVNFNLVCKVKRKVLPVTLNVKAEGYAMNCQLLCEDSQGINREFVSDGINIIRFGEVLQ